MMQEAAFTELINKESLEKLQQLEDDNKGQWNNRRERFAPGELIVKFKQTKTDQGVKSKFTFPSQKQYPKNLWTKLIQRQDQPVAGQKEGAEQVSMTQQAAAKYQQKVYHPYSYIQTGNGSLQPIYDGSSTSHGPVPLMCPITGQVAKYRDPLTGQPFATKEAFKILREKYFQKEDEKLFLRMQVLNDML